MTAFVHCDREGYRAKYLLLSSAHTSATVVTSAVMSKEFDLGAESDIKLNSFAILLNKFAPFIIALR